MEKKIQLGVIFGSRSCEREVAIISAVQLMRHVNRDKYDVIPIYIDTDGSWYTGEPLKEIANYQPFRNSLPGIQKVFLDMTARSGALLTLSRTGTILHRTEITVAARIDVFVVVMHGMNGEDGSLQGMLELANVPYTSTSIAGSAVGMDKVIMKQFFLGAKLPVLPGKWFTRREFETDPEKVCQEIESSLGFPVFVKPANLGSSIGVSRADNTVSLKEGLLLAFEYDRKVLVEKGLNKPIELNCSVLGYDTESLASPIEMPLSSEDFLDFSEKYLSGGGSKGMASLHRVLPAPIEDDLKERIQDMSKKIFHLMDCKGCVRIDYMFDRESEQLFITEINTIPGSLAFYLWENDGISYSELIDRMVGYAIRAHEDKNISNYAFTSNILKNLTPGSKGSKGAKGSIKL